MFDWIKRPVANPPAQANALAVQGAITAPVTQINVHFENGKQVDVPFDVINFVLENGTQTKVPLDIKWNATKVQPDTLPSQLLHWRRRLTDLMGRDDELAALKVWAQGGVNSSQAQVIVGDGGVGKTRLAMELADWLRVNQHWRAGGLSLSAASSFRALGAIAGNTLIVVDYPEANPDAVRRLLRAVVESEANKSIKLLFLTREHESMSAVVRDARAQDLFAPTPLMLVPFADAAYALFCAAFKAVTTQSDVLPPNYATFTAWQSRSPLHAAALFLVAAGISVARYPGLGGASDAIPIGVELLDRMCDDETSKLQDIARGVKANPDAAVDVLALATLLGDINFDTLVALPEASACGIDDAPSLRKTLLASGHATLDDATSVLNVSRLEPDLFAAAFMHRWHVGRWKAGAATQARLSTLAAQYFSTSESVTLPASLNQWNRLAFDNAVRLEQVPNRLDAWLCELLQSHAVLNRALTHTWSSSSLWVGLPKSSTANRDALADVADDAERATLLHNGAANMASAGDREGALETAREAVELYRKLAQANPVVYTPDWAMSLNNLAGFQSATGDHEGALKTAREAVELRRKLAQANPAAYTPDWATSLNNLANFQSETGDREGALKTAREAVELRRKLAQANPAAYTPDWAMSLNNLANFQSETEDRAGALKTAREAVELYRKLAQANPAAYTPDWATSLNNLASFQSVTADREGALKTAEQAVELRRKLSQANPAAYTPDLARSLCVFAMACASGDRLPDGIVAAKEAVALLEPFAEHSPAAFGGLLQVATQLRDQLLA